MIIYIENSHQTGLPELEINPKSCKFINEFDKTEGRVGLIFKTDKLYPPI